MKKLTLIGLLALLAIGVSAPLSASIVTVNANMNIFGAGHPLPPFSGLGTEGVTPLLVPVTVTGGDTVTFSATGFTSCGGNAPCNVLIGPDGAALTFLVPPPNGTQIDATAGLNVGISGITFNGRDMFLTGVFIGATEPTGVGPAALTYTSAVDTTTSFSPLLGQSFYIGDGHLGNGALLFPQQTFTAPVGATRLYLGFMDSFNNFVGFPSAYTDNTGSLTVDVAVVPEPGTLMLMGLGLFGVVLARKRHAR